MFTHLGVEVIDERPYEITRSDGVRVYVYDFGLRTPHVEDWGDGGDRDARRLLFQDAVRAVWTGAAESDGFNALVLRRRADLAPGRHPADATRSTCARPGRRSARTTSRPRCVANPAISRMLVELFETRFDPASVCG